MNQPRRITPNHFRRLATIVAAGLAVLVLVTGGTMYALYRRAKATPAAYEAALEIPAERLEEDRRALESQITTLYSDTQSLESWQSRVTAAQINAWLATRLKADFPDFERTGFSDPRVTIGPLTMTIAARGAVGQIEGVLSVALAPIVTDAGELALEIRSAELGELTLPIEGVVARLSAARIDRLAPVRWSQTESRSVLLVDLDRVADSDRRDLRLTGVDLRVGELLVRGESRAIDPEPGDADAPSNDASDDASDDPDAAADAAGGVTPRR